MNTRLALCILSWVAGFVIIAAVDIRIALGLALALAGQYLAVSGGGSS